jgi:hypothetical protein
MTKDNPKCSVKGCEAPATCEVILYDVYTHNGEVFFERDFTCPYLCSKHIIENEEGAKGEREPRGVVHYPHSNRQMAQGFTIYRPLE